MQASTGVNLALDSDNDSSMLHYSAHVDYEALPGLYLLLEFNGFTTIDEGTRTPLDFEGVDLVNFGSTESGTVLSAAAGFRYHFNRHFQMGAAYECAVSARKDVLDERHTVDVIIRYQRSAGQGTKLLAVSGGRMCCAPFWACFIDARTTKQG